MDEIVEIYFFVLSYKTSFVDQSDLQESMMKSFYYVVLVIWILAPYRISTAQNNSQAVPDRVSTVEGDLRLHQLTSKIFGNTRTIRVLLPPGYSDKSNRKKKYPVLYLNDGQNLFDVSTSIFNPLEWQVDETAARLIRSGKIEPLIIVGIDNAGKSLRPNEYLPFPDSYLTPPLPNPEGRKYPDFLLQEVMPLINQNYRTKNRPGYTGIGGSSYGALIALYTIIAKPQVFGRLLLESPSLYVSDQQVIKDSRNLREFPRKIYIGVGTNEGDRKECKPGDLTYEAVQDVFQLKQIFQTAGFDARHLKVVTEDCARHDEAAWARRLPDALEFLYRKNKP